MGYSLIQAVNYVLVRANETSISSLSQDSSSASTLAQQFLENERLAVLGEGLQFNTRIKRLSPNSNGEILFGNNILAVDGDIPANKDNNYTDGGMYTISDGKLFDIENQTTKFDKDVHLRVLYDFSFEQIPRHVQYKIMTRTALSFMSQFSADETQIRDMAELARRADSQAQAKELDSTELNLMEKSPIGAVQHSGYMQRFKRRS